MKKQKITKAIIPAAGFGTRFLPASKSIPKEMFPIIDKPTIQFIVEEAVKSGITDILIVVSGYKNSIIDHFDYNYELEQKLISKNKMHELNLIKAPADMVRVQFVRQKEALGLGHAILLGEKFCNNEPFAILLGDDVVFNKKNYKPALAQCIDAFYETNSSIVGVQKVDLEEVSKYGIINPANNKTLNFNTPILLKGVVEKPNEKETPSQYAILGRYVLSPKIFSILRKTSPDIRDEIELTDALLTLLKKDKVYAKEFIGYRYDIGSKLGYIKAILHLALEDENINQKIVDFVQNKN